MKNYKLKPSKAKDISSLVKLGKYDWSNSDINEFPYEPTKAKEIELIRFDKYISSDDAIKELDSQGLRPATATELLLFGIQYPEVQREFPIVALGTVRRVRDDRRVACLLGRSGGRGLGVSWFEGGWGDRCRFAAVRKCSDAGMLGVGEELDPLDGKTIEINGVKYRLEKIKS